MAITIHTYNSGDYSISNDMVMTGTVVVISWATSGVR